MIIFMTRMMTVIIIILSQQMLLNLLHPEEYYEREEEKQNITPLFFSQLFLQHYAWALDGKWVSFLCHEHQWLLDLVKYHAESSWSSSCKIVWDAKKKIVQNKWNENECMREYSIWRNEMRREQPEKRSETNTRKPKETKRKERKWEAEKRWSNIISTEWMNGKNSKREKKRRNERNERRPENQKRTRHDEVKWEERFGPEIIFQFTLDLICFLTWCCRSWLLLFPLMIIILMITMSIINIRTITIYRWSSWTPFNVSINCHSCKICFS